MSTRINQNATALLVDYPPAAAGAMATASGVAADTTVIARAIERLASALQGEVGDTAGKGSVNESAVLTPAQRGEGKAPPAVSDFGAYLSNELESVARSLSIASQNLRAARTGRTDTDISAEIVTYTKDQILTLGDRLAHRMLDRTPRSLFEGSSYACLTYLSMMKEANAVGTHSAEDATASVPGAAPEGSFTPTGDV